MKKVCFVTTVSMTLRAFVLDMVLEMHNRHADWDITFVCDEDKEFAASLPPYIRYYPIAMKRGISPRGLSSLWKMKKLFKKERFDLVQYATPNAALYASLAAKMARVPRRLYCQWGIRYVGFSGWKRRMFRAFEKITCRFSTHVNAVSPLNRVFAIEEGLYPADKAVVVGNGGTVGVDLEKYDLASKAAWRQEIRAQYALGESVTFGFVGRLSRDKGMLELLAATKTLSEIRNVKLICVGDSELDASAAPDLVEWARESGTVIFTGRQPAALVSRFYAAMDVYVHPTYREGFGMVLQEAGAMSCPVITTRIPGASEVLEENKSCLLCEPRSIQSLYEAMKRLCDDPALCADMGAAARQHVEKRYERGLMLDHQIGRYEKILEDGLV